MLTCARLRLCAVALSVLLAAGCGGGGDATGRSSEPPLTRPAGATATPLADDAGTPTDGGVRSGSSTPAPDGEDGAVEAVPEGQELLLRTAGGEVTVIATLDPEGESFFVSAAARPGGTARDATVVAVTQAEGMYDLRWLEVVDGRAGELLAFDEPYRPTSGMRPVDSIGPSVAWSPDGGSVGWIEWDGDGTTTLRTVGWDGAPGTGDDATDNAAFGVEPIPAGARIQAWTGTGASTSRIDVLGPDGGRWTITVERQADGALALPPAAVQER